jgi:hypothetical protein
MDCLFQMFGGLNSILSFIPRGFRFDGYRHNIHTCQQGIDWDRYYGFEDMAGAHQNGYVLGDDLEKRMGLPMVGLVYVLSGVSNPCFGSVYEGQIDLAVCSSYHCTLTHLSELRLTNNI